jgi:hypothetical protein
VRCVGGDFGFKKMPAKTKGTSLGLLSAEFCGCD